MVGSPKPSAVQSVSHERSATVSMHQMTPLMLEQWAGRQVSVTCVHVPLEQEKEQLPMPVAQVPVSVLPLFVVVRTQLFVVPAVHCAAQVLVTCVHVPRLHE